MFTCSGIQELRLVLQRAENTKLRSNGGLATEVQVFPMKHRQFWTTTIEETEACIFDSGGSRGFLLKIEDRK